MIWLLIAATLATAGKAIPFLLSKVISWGGDRMDGLDNASQLMAEANAFRGSRDPNEVAWDGRNRVGPVDLLP